MSIKVGDRVPNATLKKMGEKGPENLSTESLFGGKKVVLFSVPGAFTPTCSAKHMPGFVQHAADFKAKGIDTVACMAVNDVFVMKAWAKDQGKLNNGLDVAMAKYFAGEVATKCSNFAMRILGAYGYSTEYPVARYYRDAPTYSMVEGSANICKMIIALDQLGVKKANR